jgi:hypothetical protein
MKTLELKTKYENARNGSKKTRIISIDPGLTKNVGYCYIVVDNDDKTVLELFIGVFPTQNVAEYHLQVKNILGLSSPSTECLVVIVENQFLGNKKLQKAEGLIVSAALDAGAHVVGVMHARTKDPYFQFQKGADRKASAVSASESYLERHQTTFTKEALKTFRSTKKKDDMSDALLMALTTAYLISVLDCPEHIRNHKKEVQKNKDERKKTAKKAKKALEAQEGSSRHAPIIID